MLLQHVLEQVALDLAEVADLDVGGIERLQPVDDDLLCLALTMNAADELVLILRGPLHVLQSS